MTPDERAAIAEAAQREADAAPELTPAQRDHLNAVFRGAMAAVRADRA